MAALRIRRVKMAVLRMIAIVKDVNDEIQGMQIMRRRGMVK